MPINDPIKGKKVAPASLAFDPRRKTGGSVVTTYQSDVTQIVERIETGADLNPLRRGLTVADRDAEMRAKNWSSDWHRNFHWDVNTDIDIQNNAWHPIAFSNEHMRGMGCQPVGGFVAPTAWKWVVPYGWEGSWFVFAHISIQAQAAANVSRALLGITVNNTIRIVLDRLDTGYTGEVPIRDIVLRSGSQISVQPHDEVAVALFLVGAVGTDTYGHPSSVTGYVDGFRTRCGFDHIVESSGDNSGYVFV